jgi:hypothetical protein
MLRRSRSRSSSLPAWLPLRARRRRSALGAARLPALVGALAALAAAGAALLRRRRSEGADLRPAPGSAPSQEPATTVVNQDWSCECGQAYRVSGEGRHRIYWLPDAPVSDPVTDGRCASCGRELPGDQVSPVDREASR